MMPRMIRAVTLPEQLVADSSESKLAYLAFIPTFLIVYRWVLDLQFFIKLQNRY